ncbi:ABC transporter permease [Brevibacterium litoralis]|uniref:ABC transporter permease n=1 Tax=Brevibacterium litoralis TaxID=3138935 RepID=UPI0032ECFEEE
MTTYVIKRVLALIPVLAVVAIVTFALIHMMPGDPAAVILGPEATAEQIEALREELGLTAPLYVQFFAWLGDVLTGDLGTSVFTRDPVTQMLVTALGPTVSLAVLAQLLALFIAIPAGIIAARRRGTLVDQGMMGGALLGISVPSFLLGLLLMLVFAVWLQWFPVAGYAPLSEGLGRHLQFLVLPAVALGTMQAALIARMTRSSMLDVFSQNYMKTAKAKGLSEWIQVIKHAFRNAALPVLTVVGQGFGVLIAGAAVVETVFNIPGIGQLIVNSVERRDFVVIQGVVLMIAVVYVLVNLVVDLLYSVLDPRVRFD